MSSKYIVPEQLGVAILPLVPMAIGIFLQNKFIKGAKDLDIWVLRLIGVVTVSESNRYPFSSHPVCEHAILPCAICAIKKFYFAGKIVIMVI